MKLVAPPASASPAEGQGGTTLIVGASEVMKGVYAYVETIAPYKINILIIGETGAGKEVIARKVHELSDRRASRLYSINCASIPSELLEYELFGIEKGAVPGVAARIGIFEQADGGTLFLDEVTEMALLLQGKLLRAIREGTFNRIGRNEPIKVDVRIIAATNRDPLAAIAEGKLRKDLYYRLSGGIVRVPPVRERREDIPALVVQIVSRYQYEFAQVFTEVSDEVITRLCELPLEGNVAEMENILHEAMAFASRDRSEAIELRHLRAEVRANVPQPPLPHHVRGRIPSREEIIEALNQNGWKLTKTAAEFKVTDRALRDWMSQYNIKRPD